VFATEPCGRALVLARHLRQRWDARYAGRLVDRFQLPLRRTPQQLSRGQRSALACILGLASRAPLTSSFEHRCEDVANRDGDPRPAGPVQGPGQAGRVTLWLTCAAGGSPRQPGERGRR
jgi:hypothetical protein